MDGGPGLRLLRAAVFAALSVALAVGGHLWVTGEPLPLSVVLVAGAGCLGVGLLLAAAERGFVAIAAVLIPLQLALNALFNAGQQSCPPGRPSPSGSFGLLVCGGGSVRPGLLGEVSQLGPHALVTAALGPLLLLLAAHLLAALLTAGWLASGERAAFTLLRTAALATWSGCAALLAWLLPLPQPPAHPGLPSRAPRDPAPAPLDVVRRAIVRRGPPSAAVAC